VTDTNTGTGLLLGGGLQEGNIRYGLTYYANVGEVLKKDYL